MTCTARSLATSATRPLGTPLFPEGRTILTRAKSSAATWAAHGRKTSSSIFCQENISEQDLYAPAIFNAPFDVLDGSYKAPFHETEGAARLDYKLSAQSRAFYRFTYDNGSDVNAFGGSNYQPLKSRGTAYGNGLGFDFTRGPYLHSIRFAYDRYSNNIEDAVAGANVLNPAPGMSLNFMGGSGFASGSIRRRRSRPSKPTCTGPLRRHPDLAEAIRFASVVAVNKIDTLISANLFGSAPQMGSDTGAEAVLFAGMGPFAGGASNPLNYPVNSITLGNGFSCFSEKSGLGSSCGAFNDTRMQAYLGDTWKF